MKTLSILLFAVLFTTNAMAKEVGGVDINDKLSIENNNLMLNGAGIRNKFFFDVYVISLYTTKPAATLEQVLQDNAAIKINIISSMVTNDKMQKTLIEGFEKATNNNLAPIQPQIDSLKMFEKEIKVNDEFVIFKNKDRIIIYKNGTQVNDITHKQFTEALFKIWLGDNPVKKSLKQELLGAK